MQFSEFVKTKALEEKLPFEIDIEPVVHDESVVLTTIGRFQIPKYDELLTRESWFFEVIASTIGQRRIELQIEIFSLAKLLKTELNLESDSVALKTLQELTGNNAEAPEGETEEQKKAREAFNDQKQSFFMRHLDRFTRLSDMVAATEEGAVEAWMRITFFLLSRYSADWTFSKTASLRKSEIDNLIKFINQEANGGVLPEEPVEEPDLGKESKNSESQSSDSAPGGALSTGKLAVAT